MNQAPNFQNLTIISGGQTGADRAALDWALQHGIPHGGSCPRGRLAEDGVIPTRYQLQELPSPEYAARTERDVLDADGTVIFSGAYKTSLPLQQLSKAKVQIGQSR
jgi:predicted Rossmann-fold nucleotide-binding protein